MIRAIDEFIRMCGDGWRMGWHESNGGNLSYRMTEEEAAAMRGEFREPAEWTGMEICAESLSGGYFVVTGSGKHFRVAELFPKETLGIVEINGSGSAWRTVWGLEGGGKPTSELMTHFALHGARISANSENRVIYHCHAPNIMALTYMLPLTDRDFSRALWQSATECPIVLPEGVGVCGWVIPGSAEAVAATEKLMRRYRAAVWAHHGLFVSGTDFDAAFGTAHTIEKCAEIYLKVHSLNMPVLQTISDDQLRAAAKRYGAVINEEFLD